MASNTAPVMLYFNDMTQQGHSSFAFPCARDKFEFSVDLGYIWQGVTQQRRSQGTKIQVEKASRVPCSFKYFSLKMQGKWKGFFHSIPSCSHSWSMSHKSKSLPSALVARRGAVWHRTCWDRCKMMGISWAKPRTSWCRCKGWWCERNCKEQTRDLEAAAPAFLIPVLILILVSVGMVFDCETELSWDICGDPQRAEGSGRDLKML